MESVGEILGRLAAEHNARNRPAKVARRLDWGLLLNAAAIAGATLAVIFLGRHFILGGWPLHDTATYWVGGMHLREGASVYAVMDPAHPTYLGFVYAPPWAVLWMPLSLLPLNVMVAVVFGLNVLAIRYVAGSWRNAGLLMWLPFTWQNLSSGNVDWMMAATIFASVRSVRGSGFSVALFSAAKMSPAVTLIRGRWREAVVGGLVLLAITLPWLHLWPEYVTAITGGGRAGQTTMGSAFPLLPRIVGAVALLVFVRRPWAVAAAAALFTPAFYFHSLLLLIPAARIWIEDRRFS